MRPAVQRRLLKQPVEAQGLSFFDLPRAAYQTLAEGVADECRWHFQRNGADDHMAYLRTWGARLASWSRGLAFPKGSVHLDIGAGEGVLSYLVARRGHHSIAVDLSATILHSASLFKAGVEEGPGASQDASMALWVADIYNLPLKPQSVDFVTVKEVLHHLDDLDGLMRELSRVLKPNGMVYLWEPFFISVPVWRAYFERRTRPRELALGIRHVYHTYWTYQKLARRWLVDPVIEREFELTKLQHHLTRNRFTQGEVFIRGRIKSAPDPAPLESERRQIRPEDFLFEDLLADGLRTTLRRKAFLDELLAQEDAQTAVPARS